MALALKTEFLISPDTISLKNITGTYDALSNPGGYGTPNEAFDDFAHYAILTKKNVNNVADVVLAINAYDPLSALQFTAPRTVDGWFEGVLLDVRFWDDAEANTVGQIRHVDGNNYIAIQDGTNHPPASSPSYWEAIALADMVDNDSVEVLKSDTISIFNADVYWSKKMAGFSKQGKCGVCEDDREKRRMDDIEFHISAANVACGMGNYVDGEWNVLSLLKLGAK